MTKTEAILGGRRAPWRRSPASRAAGRSSPSFQPAAAPLRPAARRRCLGGQRRRTVRTCSTASPCDRPQPARCALEPGFGGGRRRQRRRLRRIASRPGRRRKLEAVNGYVNARVRFVDDSRPVRRCRPLDRSVRHAAPRPRRLRRFRHRQARHASPRRRSDKDLYLVVLKDLSRRADHAVLVVRAAGRFLVLDNGTDRIVDSADVADYKPMLTFTAWPRLHHGYRREVPPVAMPANRHRRSGGPGRSPVRAFVGRRAAGRRA